MKATKAMKTTLAAAVCVLVLLSAAAPAAA